LERAIDRTWSRWHAPLMLVATGLALVVHAVWPVALACTVSLAMFVRLGRGQYTPGGRFGSANAVTVLRLAMTAVLAVFGLRAPDPASALLVFVVLVLDGVDGWLARNRGLASEFGALLDQECDALLVSVCALTLYLQGRLGAYVLLSGVLRYFYGMLVALMPEGAREQPRSRVGRYGFCVLIMSFIASLWPIEPWHRWLAPCATLLIVYSFGRSIYWSLSAESRAVP
jgi:phosphatidylglycerophosphate synthase